MTRRAIETPLYPKKNGIAASLMDYARFNYIAQPGDKGVRFIRQMGPYDHYAVNGNLPVIQNFLRSRSSYFRQVDYGKAGDPMYKFGKSSSFDPTSQTEDIGIAQ
jgi:hypothetical protein